MKNLNFLFVMSVLFGVSAHAFEIKNGEVLKVTTVSDFRPTYFFKPSPDGKYIAFTVFERGVQTARTNYLLDFETGEKHLIPGPFDPVFYSETKAVIPFDYAENSTGVAYGFYRVMDLVEKGIDARPVLEEFSLDGVYQSVGIVEENIKNRRLRLVIENSSAGHKMMDFIESTDGTAMQRAGESVNLCAGWEIKLPMISKNGRELSALSLKIGNSVIFTILDDGTCLMSANLKIKTGKAGFSYDGRYVAYHRYSMSAPDTVTDGFVLRPPSTLTADIYVYDRVTNQTFQITSNLGSNSLYPEFLRDGRLVFVDYSHDKSDEVRYVIVQPKLTADPQPSGSER